MDVASKALSCPSHPLHHFTGFIQRIKISFGLTAQHVPAVTPVNGWALFSRFSGNIGMVAIVNVVDIVIVGHNGYFRQCSSSQNPSARPSFHPGPIFLRRQPQLHCYFCSPRKAPNFPCAKAILSIIQLSLEVYKTYFSPSLSLTECSERHKDGKVKWRGFLHCHISRHLTFTKLSRTSVN